MSLLDTICRNSVAPNPSTGVFLKKKTLLEFSKIDINEWLDLSKEQRQEKIQIYEQRYLPKFYDFYENLPRPLKRNGKEREKRDPRMPR